MIFSAIGSWMSQPSTKKNESLIERWGRFIDSIPQDEPASLAPLAANATHAQKINYRTQEILTGWQHSYMINNDWLSNIKSDVNKALADPDTSELDLGVLTQIQLSTEILQENLNHRKMDATHIYALQAGQLCNWILDYKFKLTLNKTSFQLVAEAIKNIRSNTRFEHTHPSDMLLFLNLFNRLVTSEIDLLRTMDPSLAQLRLFEIASVSQLIAQKVCADDAAYLEEMTRYIPHSFYKAMIRSLPKEEQHRLDQRTQNILLSSPRIKSPQHALTHARFIAVEREALATLNYCITPVASEAAQAELLARLSECRRRSFFFKQGSRYYLPDNGVSPAAFRNQKAQYSRQSNRALRMLDELCRPQPALKQSKRHHLRTRR